MKNAGYGKTSMLGVEVKNRIQQLNPWTTDPNGASRFIGTLLPPKYVYRTIERSTLTPDRALLIVGPRQSGKSTLAWHLLRPFFPDVLFLNMEEPLLRIGFYSPIEFVEHLREDYSFIKAIFLDEVQHMDEAGLFVKGLVDAKLRIPILVTGSSSYHLASRTRESLAGRATRRRLLPFSLAETLSDAAPANSAAEKRLCNEMLADQLVFGSYPAVFLTSRQQGKVLLLNDLVEALILRDASDLFKIKRIDGFRKLLPLLAGQIGNLMNVSELASICNMDVGTVNAYIEILEETHIISRTRPFAGGKRREITGSPKVFFLDNGIRNQLLNAFSQDLELRTDKGQLFENWVFTEIQKVLPLQSAVRHWRSKAGAEVDFIINHAGKNFALEVKYTALKQPKLSRSARSFIDAYHPAQFVVVNMALEVNTSVGDTPVHFITPCSLPKRLFSIFEPLS
jgi:predicted AAA+ superfamily ATPase